LLNLNNHEYPEYHSQLKEVNFPHPIKNIYSGPDSVTAIDCLGRLWVWGQQDSNTEISVPQLWPFWNLGVLVCASGSMTGSASVWTGLQGISREMEKSCEELNLLKKEVMEKYERFLVSYPKIPSNLPLAGDSLLETFQKYQQDEIEMNTEYAPLSKCT
jgi:hypothetical protein